MVFQNLRKTLKRAVSLFLVCLLIIGTTGEGLLWGVNAIDASVNTPDAVLGEYGDASDLISSIIIDPVTVRENIDGWFDGYYDWETDEWADDVYFRYSFEPERFTVNFVDGTSVVYYDTQDFAEDWDIYFEPEDPQDYYEPWGIGTHTVYCYFGDYETEMTVQVVESPVERIEIPTVYLAEGVGGYLDKVYEYDEDTDEETLVAEYYYYWVDEADVTVNVCYKDGSVKSFGLSELYEEFDCSYEFITDQSAENPWVKGNKYKAVFEVLGFSVEFDVEFCDHKNTEFYPEVPGTCYSTGYEEGIYCSDCKIWIEGRDYTGRYEHKDENKDNACDLCGEDFSLYDKYLEDFTYFRYEFDENTLPEDNFVLYYLEKRGCFDEYITEGEYNSIIYTDVPYDFFMQKADEYFASHSDMMDYFTDYDFFTDESKEFLTWYKGGLGGVSDMNLTSVYNSDDGTVVLRGCVYDLFFEDYEPVVKEKIITEQYESVNEFGETVQSESKREFCGAYELVGREKDGVFQLISFKEIQSYIVDRTLMFIKEHNFRDKYYQFDIECDDGAEVVTSAGALTDEFLTFDKYNHYWFAPGSQYSFKVNAEAEMKVVLCDNNGETELIPMSDDGEYTIIPDGPAVLKVIAASSQSPTTDPTTEPGTTEPSTTEPSAAEPSATEPSTTEPGTTEPSATKPSTTEPAATKPVVTKPSSTEPATVPVTVPSATKPAEPQENEKPAKPQKPARVKLKGVKSPKKKRIVVTWNKVAGAKGYEVMHSTSKSFKKKVTKTVTIKKGTKAKVTIKKLKSNKKYFVKVRAYKTVNGTKLFGSWSKAKTVKVK